MNQTGKVLVTGGTGFLGAYILKNLIEKGFTVRATRRSAALPFFIPSGILEKVEWVDADVLDVVSLEDALEGVWAVIHAAAIVSFDRKDRDKMYQVNVEGTANVVNCAVERGVNRLIHVSSVAALGRTSRKEMVTEEKKWQDNSSNTHYAISKHHAEMHVYRGFAEGLEGVVINPSTILGYGNWHQSSCAIFKNAYKGFNWYTKGVNGFVGVEDVAEATVQLLESDISQERYILNAENWPFQKLFNTIADNFGKPRPAREATKAMGELAWRMESMKAMLTGSKPLLTRETAKVAQSQTSFDNSALCAALPGFSFTPLETVIANSCEKYKAALGRGEITL
ncbi:NAD-dependent epimerase/dehydratase family protein [Flavisolibacter ginsengisoli]|jgi:nucleoside-diphosphate-sugar epimerase|uniref:Nucleoside-diphosphate-sugar epimerase n=1 Tax=Flavisolibacter ginsengisoli DSM 18119 TaxID=1121884 RepID=A0A1M4VL52_9BACT|nr:NAD-dependent epimerase/dehydratase family protein [Flavisolibacter ginsengisoli]SHE69796.1 Nucleoside-diphosphate-sugar epimerase [Flavisolibacter ginsengisoli DSM 18119]